MAGQRDNLRLKLLEVSLTKLQQMICDPDIFHAAKLLIDQHGIDAPIRAAQRADGLLDEADTGLS